MGVPIVIGVTGHRDLREQDLGQIRALVRTELQKLSAACPHSELIMLNSIASGGDSLCAQEALDLGMRLVCPLPLELDEYRDDFSDEELETFEGLLACADEVFVVPASEPEQPGRDYRYRQAGIYVATHCHVLLALWDGTPGKPGGCGAAETVGFMLDGGYADAPPFDAASDGAVIHISVPQASKNQEVPIAAHLIEEHPGCLKDLLEQTDAFNADCGLLANDGATKGERPSTKAWGRSALMREVYDEADRLSLRFQTRYLRVLWLLSLFCVLLVLAFLLYDEAEQNLFLVAYGVVLVAYAAFFQMVIRGSHHEKYIQYRVLAETMRVQLHLSSLGMEANVSDDFTWTQRHDIAWVRKAASAILCGAPEPVTTTPDQVKSDWIDGQRAYHEHAYARDGGKHRIGGVITQAMLVCTVVAFVLITACEFFAPQLMDHAFIGISMRSWAKIVWGCLSVVVLFVAGYYGRLSFERKAYDHEKMALLFKAAALRFETDPASYETVFRELAREEIIENGNWMSYCKENRPTFSL